MSTLKFKVQKNIYTTVTIVLHTTTITINHRKYLHYSDDYAIYYSECYGKDLHQIEITENTTHYSGSCRKYLHCSENYRQYLHYRENYKKDCRIYLHQSETTEIVYTSLDTTEKFCITVITAEKIYTTVKTTECSFHTLQTTAVVFTYYSEYHGKDLF